MVFKRKKIIALSSVGILIILTLILNYLTINKENLKKSKIPVRDVMSYERIKFRQRFISGDKDAEYKISLIKIEGEITGYSEKYYFKSISDIIKNAFDIAKEDEKVKGIILQINSPGGDIVEVEKIYDKIQEIKKSKPVIALLENVATSGGYYCAVATDKIISHPLTITGNIGAVIILYNVEELFEKKLGINMNVIKSGKHKDIGSPFRKMDIEEKKIFQGLVNQAAKKFLDVVLKHRNIASDKVNIISDGRIFTGIQAKEIGLVDEIGNLDKAVSVIKEMTKIDKLKVVEYYYKPGIFDVIGLYQSEKLLFSKIPEIKTPVLKYLWLPGD
jgi:protease-4